MRHSVEPRDRRCLKGCGFLSFSKTNGKNIGKNISSKYSQKLVDSAKKSATDALKTASKRAIQKTAETTGDVSDNKIADKSTSVSTELHSKNLQRSYIQKNYHQMNPIIKYQKKDIYLQKKDKKLLMTSD